MEIAVRRAAKVFPLLPNRSGFVLGHLGSSYAFSRRLTSSRSSESVASLTGMQSDINCFLPSNCDVLTSEVGSVKDSSEFRKWQNGGGLFHMSASIDPTAFIEIGAIVHSESVLQANVYVGSGAVVGPSVSIGHSSKVGYNAALSNCFIGSACIIHQGVCIGQDGFGFYVDEKGCVVKKTQMLHARIGDNVEIGANTCIDRGSWRDTVIGDHSKIDNLVQVAHNVVIGKGCILCGQVGIAGSVTMGDYVTMGGRAMVRDHVSIASKVRIAANSGATKDITTPGDYGGFPAVPIHEWRRQAASVRRFYKDVSQN